MSINAKLQYSAPSVAKIGDFETTTLSSTSGTTFDAAFYAAAGTSTPNLGQIIGTVTGNGGLSGLVS